MRHTIFVTVAEFLDNGGVLTYGRSLYGAPNGQEIGYYIPENQRPSTYGFIVVQRHSGTFAREFDSLYVEISCTPIYE